MAVVAGAAENEIFKNRNKALHLHFTLNIYTSLTECVLLMHTVAIGLKFPGYS